MQFSQIPGLTEVKQKLAEAYTNGRVAHAQLFSGGEGGGALALALAAATFLNCANRSAEDSCGKCSSCLKISKLSHPDLHFVFPTSTTKKITKREDALSNTFAGEWRKFIGKTVFGNLTDWAADLGSDNKQLIIPVHEGRQIIKTLSLKAYEGGYKCLILWLPELMNISAANAILKILEEPPARTVFLLATQNPDQLLTTILSRTQRFTVRPFTSEEIIEHLLGRGTSRDTAAQAAALAEGNMREALHFGDGNGAGERDFFRTWMRACYRADFIDLVQRSEDFARESKDNQKNLLRYALMMFREACMFAHAGEAAVRPEAETLEFVRKFSQTVNAKNAEELRSAFENAIRYLERNASAKILFTDLSVQTAKFIRMK